MGLIAASLPCVRRAGWERAVEVWASLLCKWLAGVFSSVLSAFCYSHGIWTKGLCSWVGKRRLRLLLVLQATVPWRCSSMPASVAGWGLSELSFLLLRALLQRKCLWANLESAFVWRTMSSRNVSLQSPTWQKPNLCNGPFVYLFWYFSQLAI